MRFSQFVEGVPLQHNGTAVCNHYAKGELKIRFWLWVGKAINLLWRRFDRNIAAYMSTNVLVLKNNLHTLIDTLEDDEVLSEVTLMLENYLQHQHGLSDWEQQKIQEGLQSLENEPVVSHQTILEQIQQWKEK